MFCQFPTQEAKVAAAHRLTLRERSLVYEVDEHIGPSILSSDRFPPFILNMNGGEEGRVYLDQGTYIPSVCEPSEQCGTGLGVTVPAARLVIPLEGVSEITIETHREMCCKHHDPFASRPARRVGGAAARL